MKKLKEAIARYNEQKKLNLKPLFKIIKNLPAFKRIETKKTKGEDEKFFIVVRDALIDPRDEEFYEINVDKNGNAVWNNLEKRKRIPLGNIKNPKKVVDKFTDSLPDDAPIFLARG